ncbi:pilus assembly FimT family protein [Desulfobaculum bizertense]|uniref:Type II secretory pathway, pseudopilin PulG n=1 Tax=Desulfobaculum bizertense DSM 18034 TaxID=1121442 RepID=A0A1T4VHA9_9BACT|nr:type II secretion system protein [Desulfobaculum bizertense]UIJ37841.1 type II secretion system GspH family protein [Desulfobaculum bizertense]SKA64347.1 Type II secretory pathway, pseudopilin PulG [Desulfobaculum bizertense DSM 18034]
MHLQRHASRPTSCAGFTMLELLAIITLLGILAVAAVSSMGTLSESSLIGQTEVLKRHIRYTQHRAMSTRSTWKITASAKNHSYALFQVLEGDKDQVRRFPTEQSDSRVLPDGVTFSEDWTIEFSPRGEPEVSKLQKDGHQWAIRLCQGKAKRQFKLTEFTGFLTETERVP